jgi:CheY-like chemotaxis protein
VKKASKQKDVTVAPAGHIGSLVTSLLLVPRRILIVDDSPAFRELECRLLQAHGYELVAAQDGVEGIRLALTQRPDLILLDLQMPVMTGQQALGILKRDARMRGIPVVVVTTKDDSRECEQLERAGAAALLTKPINATVLLGTVRRLLGASM